MKCNNTNAPVGLTHDSIHGWSYAAGKLLVTSSPTNMPISANSRTFEPNVCPRICGSADAVQQFYTDILAVDATDSRSLGLIAAAASAWWTIFAERLKGLNFQIPAVMYIGSAGGFKSTFLNKTLFLKPCPGQKTPVIYSYSRKKVDELLKSSLYAQVIISDVRKEGASNYGKFTLLLDEIVRPVAEEPDMPGSVLIAAETNMLDNKNMSPSLLQRIIQVPMDSLKKQEENEDWLLNLTERCPVGDLIFTVLPRLLTSLNDHADGYPSQWESNFKVAYDAFRVAHKAPGHRRELNQRFLILRAHEEILNAAHDLNFITSEQQAQAMTRISDVAKWFFQRQMAISTRFDVERIRTIFETLSSQLRFVPQRNFCTRFQARVPNQCYNCNSFYSRSSTSDRNTCVYAEPAVDLQELHLRAGELGVVTDPIFLQDTPKHCHQDCFLLIIRRKAFLEEVEYSYEEETIHLHLPSFDFKASAFNRTLKDMGILAYRPRDDDGNQVDYAIRWTAVKTFGNWYVAENNESVLILQIPKEWNLRFAYNDFTYQWQDDTPEIFCNVPSVSGFKFQHIRL